MENGFHFVMQGPGGSGLSGETRTLIRRQAMRAVGAARRQRGMYGKSNLRQAPVMLNHQPLPQDMEPAIRSVAAAPLGWRAKNGSRHGRRCHAYHASEDVQQCPNGPGCSHAARFLPSPMPLSGLDLFLATHGVALTDLGALSAAHIPSISSALLNERTGNLGKLLSCGQASYFEHLPPRHGHSIYLDSSLSCLVQEAKHHLVPGLQTEASRAQVLANYGQALSSLQAAINDKERWADPEVLCAADILALFELLRAPSDKAWSRHLAGAAKIIQTRGPGAFQSQFEKALFVPLAARLISESFMSNEDCFLQQPEWKAVYLSCIIPEETFSERSALSIEIYTRIFHVPSISRRVTEIICDDSAPFVPSEVDLLANDIRKERYKLQDWRRRYDAALALEDPKATTSGMHDHRFELLTVSLITMMFLGRMLSSIAPASRSLLENEVSSMALEAKELRRKVIESHYRAGFYLGQKIWVADAMLDTNHLWMESTREGGLIEKWKFEHLCATFGRRMLEKRKVQSPPTDGSKR